MAAAAVPVLGGIEGLRASARARLQAFMADSNATELAFEPADHMGNYVIVEEASVGGPSKSRHLPPHRSQLCEVPLSVDGPTHEASLTLRLPPPSRRWQTGVSGARGCDRGGTD